MRHLRHALWATISAPIWLAIISSGSSAARTSVTATPAPVARDARPSTPHPTAKFVPITPSPTSPTSPTPAPVTPPPTPEPTPEPAPPPPPPAEPPPEPVRKPVGEVLADSPVSAQEIFGIWMASPPHYAILMGARYADIGMGCAQGTLQDGNLWALCVGDVGYPP